MTFATHKTLKSRDTGLGPVTDPVRITRRFIAASSNSADVNKASASVLPRGMPPPVTWQRINMDCSLLPASSLWRTFNLFLPTAYSLHTHRYTHSHSYTQTHKLLHFQTHCVTHTHRHTHSYTHTRQTARQARCSRVCEREREEASLICK